MNISSRSFVFLKYHLFGYDHFITICCCQSQSLLFLGLLTHEQVASFDALPVFYSYLAIQIIPVKVKKNSATEINNKYTARVERYICYS